jgi:hypothetical protein
MDDLEQLIKEHGLTPVPQSNPQINSLVNEFGLVPAKTEGGYGVGTLAKDITKNVAAGAVPGVLGAPEAVESSAYQQVRATQSVPEDVINYLAHPQNLADKFLTSLGFPPIFKKEEQTLIPQETIAKQNMALDEVLTRGKIPQLKSLTEFGNKLGQDIQQTVSPEMQLAMANFVPTGSLKDIASGNFKNLSLGANPTLLGLAGQFSNVFGSVAPGMLGTILTKNPAYMEAFGFGQAGSEAVGNAREYVKSLDDNQLSNNSPYFRELLAAGYDPKRAREMTEEQAVDRASMAEGAVGALGGAFTANLITGKFDKALINSVRNRALNIVYRTGKGATLGAGEEGLQEMSEGIASDLGIDKTVAKEIGADAFSNLILGAIGGGGPGAVSGLKAKSTDSIPKKEKELEKVTTENGVLQQGKNVSVEAAPAEFKPKLITEEELETEKKAKTPEYNTANLSPEDKKTWNGLLQESKILTAEHLNNYDTISPERAQEIQQKIAENDAKMAELEAKPPYEPTKAEKKAKREQVEEAEIPSAKPGFEKWRTENGYIFSSKEDYEAALPELKKQYEAEISNAPVTSKVEEQPTEVSAAKKEAPKETKKEAPVAKTPEETTEEVEELPKFSQAKDVPVIPKGEKIDSTDPKYLEKFNEIMETYEPESGSSQEDSFLDALNKDIKSKKEVIEAPAFKKGARSQASIEVAPFNGGWVGGSQIMNNLGGYASGVSVFDDVYPTKQEAIHAQIDRLRKSAESYKNTKALSWLDLIDSRVSKEGKIEANKARQAAKKEKIGTVENEVNGKKLTTTYERDKNDNITITKETPEGTIVTNIGGGKKGTKTKQEFIPKEKTQAEINKERQAEKKAAAEKAKQPLDTSEVPDADKIRKKNGYVIYKRKSDMDYWRVQSVENKLANRIGDGDSAHSDLGTAEDKIYNNINAEESKKEKPVEKPVEKKEEPKKAAPKEKAAPVSEEEELIKEAALYAKAAGRSNVDEDIIREKLENAKRTTPEKAMDLLKGTIENFKKQAKDYVIREASEDYNDQIGHRPSKNSSIVDAIKGGALNIEGKPYAQAFYKMFNINPEKIKKTEAGTPIQNQLVKFESNVFSTADSKPEVYKEAAVKFLESPLTSPVPKASQAKLDPTGLENLNPLPIEKKAYPKAVGFEGQIKALAPTTATEDVRYYLKGVHIEDKKNRLVATDGHRMAIINNADLKGMPEFKGEGDKILGKDGKYLEGKFPEVDRVVSHNKVSGEGTKVKTTDLGDYARGVRKAWKYVSGDKYTGMRLTIGDKTIGLNAIYVEDMANLFKTMGYDTFNAYISENSALVAKSPDGKVYQIVMGMRDPSPLFSAFQVGPKKLTKEPVTIDIEATEITPEQKKLITNQTSKLDSKETETLEKHYGEKAGSDGFVKRVREDIITFTNKGAEAVDKAIRSIIAKLQAGMLAVAMVFNPAYMSQQSAVTYPTKTITEQVRAAVPESAKEMSESAKKAYAALQPALQSSDKLFTIVDKPTSKVFVFNPNGTLLVKDNVVLGMAMGDAYVGQTDFKANRITPAGLFTVKSEKGGATYDGKTIYTVGNTKEGWNTAFMHTVYLKESDAEARKKALATGEATRLSHGCVNASPEVMAKIGEDNRMDGSHVFVVPDNQAKVDDYIANNVSNEDLTRETITPVTKTTKVPEQKVQRELFGREEEGIEPKKTQAEINQERQNRRRQEMLKAESPYYGTFTNNLDENEFEKMRYETNQEKRKQLASDKSRRVNTTITKILRDLVNGKFDINTQRETTEVLKARTEARKEKKQEKVEITSARWFVKQAMQDAEMHQKYPNDPQYGLEEDVVAVIEDIYKKYPKLLEGLKLSIKAAPQRGAAGNFGPLTRLVTLYKNTSGTSNPRTLRHEIMHSVEQMMPDDVYQMVVDNWAQSLEKAIAKYQDDAHKEYFNRVIDFIIHPTQENQDRALDVMPSYSLYQYINPSEFWAVNAEKLFAQKLGGRWENFKRAIQKLFESFKSLFGFENTYGVHKAFDKLFKGPMERGDNERMLVDYVKRNNPEATFTFLNNVEDIDETMDIYDRPDPPPKPKSFFNQILHAKTSIKDLRRKVRENKTIGATNMIGSVGRGVLYTRIKNVWFGAGLDEADRVKYNGALRDSEGNVAASIAVTNAIHAGHIGTQVMLLGKLAFDKTTQMFHATKDSHSLANVIRLKNKLENKLGTDRAYKLVQAYFEAKRSRSITNEYLERSKELESLLEEQMKPTTSDERQMKLIKEIADAQEDLKNIQRAVDKVNMDDDQIDKFISYEDEYSELREMMDNWTSVNRNMIDMMELSSIISKKRAQTLRDIEDYVPWYRIQEDMLDVHSPTGVKSLTDVSREKTFKEGTTELEIDDMVDNMIHNVMMLTRNSMRNYAANRVAIEYGERNEKGKLQVYPKEDRDKGIFNVLANGKRINVRIADPLIAESVLGLENVQIPLDGILRFFANGLRYSVTVNPIFQLKQLFMDAPTAALVTGVKHPYILWAGTFGGFIRAAVLPNDPIVRLLKSYGIGGFRSSARAPEHEIKQEIGILNKNYFDKALKILDHIGDASDYGQRVAVYKRVLAETKSKQYPDGDQMQAILQANNVIDFQKKGSGSTAQILTRTVSFMNAYAQQIDVLTQALAGKGLKGLKRQEALARLAWAGGLMGMVTLMYCAAVGSDDEYQKMDDQTKLRNFVIPKSLTGLDHAILLPMNTSASFFFKAVPEMLMNKIVNEGTKNAVDRTRLYTALGKAFAESLLGPTPFPTGIKPFAEIGLNHDFFTGGTITPKGMEKLDPSLQYTNTTSELGKVISKFSGGALNPIQADHIMRGLGGTIAAAAMWGSNLFSGDRPDAEAKSNPLYGSFIAADVPRGREDLFYDLQERTDKAMETYKKLAQRQRPEATEWFKDHKELITASGFTTQAASSLKYVNAEIRRLSDLPESKMNATQKREKIRYYQNIKNGILEQTIAFRKKAGL